MRKENISYQERKYLLHIINRMAERMTEEDALVLTCLYKFYRDRRDPNVDISKTVNDVMQVTGLDKNKARLSLRVLETALFLNKKRACRNWVYTITDEGCLALNYLLNQKTFPGRKGKFVEIINENSSENSKKEGK